MDEVMINPQVPGTVQGYKPQSEKNVALVNQIKAMETEVAKLWKLVVNDQDISVDKRMTALARTKFEEGFMWLVRSIFQPNTEFDRPHTPVLSSCCDPGGCACRDDS